MQAGGVGLISAQFGDNWLDPCVLIPCNKVGHKFFLTSEKQVLRLQSSDFPIVLKGNGYLQTIHKLLPFSSTGPSSRSQAVLKLIGYALLSGTSTACPLVASISALIKSALQDWSPDAIKISSGHLYMAIYNTSCATTASQIETDGMNVFEEGPALLQSYSQRSRPVRHGW
ncbi:hypothetical protein Q3G72_001827 [Acer saccharum]|nr:hypothetical protein Q3G72_001827 [Acer saccharum]